MVVVTFMTTGMGRSGLCAKQKRPAFGAERFSSIKGSRFSPTGGARRAVVWRRYLGITQVASLRKDQRKDRAGESFQHLFVVEQAFLDQLLAVETIAGPRNRR